MFIFPSFCLPTWVNYFNITQNRLDCAGTCKCRNSVSTAHPGTQSIARFQELWKVFWLLHVLMTNHTSFGATASSLIEPFSVSKSWYLCILHRSPRLAISRDQHDFTAVLDLVAFASPSGAHFYSAEH